MVDIWSSATEVGRALVASEVSAEEITGAFIERGRAVEDRIHAYLAPTFETRAGGGSFRGREASAG